VLFFDEDEGAEIEALDLGAGLHVLAEDGVGEGVDEGLGIDGVIFEEVGWGSWGEALGHFGGEVIGEDLGFEVEADLFGGEGALGGVGVGAAAAGAVVLGVEADEVEELGGVGGDEGAAEAFLAGVGGGDGGEGKVVVLVGKGGAVELVADIGVLGFGERDVADVNAVVERVGFAVGATAGFGVEELVVTDEGLAVGGDAGVGLEGGDEVVEAGLEGGQGIFGAEAASAAVGGDVEVCEALALFGGEGAGTAGFVDDVVEEVGAVGDDAVDAEADEVAHFGGVVGGPGDDADALGVQCVDGNAAVKDEVVGGGEDGRGGGPVGVRVRAGLLHEAEVWVGCGGGLLRGERHGGKG